MRVSQKQESFLNRSTKYVNENLPLSIFGTVIACFITGQLLGCFALFLLIILIQYLYGAHTNVFQITELQIQEHQIHIEVYKFNEKFVSGKYSKDEIKFNKKLKSSSKYGNTFILEGQVDQLKFEQIENEVWTESKMNDLICLLNH